MTRTHYVALIVAAPLLAGQAPPERPPWPPEYDLVSDHTTSAERREMVVVTDANDKSERSGTVLTENGYSTAVFWQRLNRRMERYRLQSVSKAKYGGKPDDRSLLNGTWVSTGEAVNSHPEVLVNLYRPKDNKPSGIGLWQPQVNVPRWENGPDTSIVRRGRERPSDETQQKHFYELLSVSKIDDAEHVDGTCLSDERLIGAYATVNGVDQPVAVHASPAQKGAQGYDVQSRRLVDGDDRFRGGRPLAAHQMKLGGWVRVLRDGQARSVGVIWQLQRRNGELSLVDTELFPVFERITSISANGFAGIGRRTKDGEVQRGIVMRYRGRTRWLASVNTPPHVDINDHGLVVSKVYHDGMWEPVAWHPNKPDGLHLSRARHPWDGEGEDGQQPSLTLLTDNHNRIYVRHDRVTQSYERTLPVQVTLVPEWYRKWNSPEQRRKREAKEEAQEGLREQQERRRMRRRMRRR